MAVAFPAGLNLCVGTVLDDDDGVMVDRTDDGAMAVRQMYPQSYYVIDAVWSALSRANHSTLRNFLQTNRINELLLTVDDATYTVRQVAPMRVSYRSGGGRVEASVRFRGTRNA